MNGPLPRVPCSSLRMLLRSRLLARGISCTPLVMTPVPRSVTTSLSAATPAPAALALAGGGGGGRDGWCSSHKCLICICSQLCQSGVPNREPHHPVLNILHLRRCRGESHSEEAQHVVHARWQCSLQAPVPPKVAHNGLPKPQRRVAAVLRPSQRACQLQHVQLKQAPQAKCR